jgi:hypothetical protein
VQALLQPSKLTLLPSSQASLDAFAPSPHLVTAQTLGWAPPHAKPHSTEQLDEHPSPLTVLPSSHVSLPAIMLSPHTKTNVLLSQSGMVGVQPGSI